MFSDSETDFLTTEDAPLGRLATIDPDGMPHVVPVGWSFDPQSGTVAIGGHDFDSTRKYRNVMARPQVALVIDDVLPPWRPRAVLIRGHGEALPADEERKQPTIRIVPEKVVSWGLDAVDR